MFVSPGYPQPSRVWGNPERRRHDEDGWTKTGRTLKKFGTFLRKRSEEKWYVAVIISNYVTTISTQKVRTYTTSSYPTNCIICAVPLVRVVSPHPNWWTSTIFKRNIDLNSFESKSRSRYCQMGTGQSKQAELNIRIQYCVSWGYKTHYKKLKSAIGNCFGKRVKVRGDQDTKVTGNFEVFIVETGTLIHSKQAGKGRGTGAKSQQRMIKKIQAVLDGHDPSEFDGRESCNSTKRRSDSSSAAKRYRE